MANKKISELQSRTPVLADLMLVGDPSSGYAYKCTITALSTVIETAIGGNYVTLATTQTISGAKTFSNNVTLTSVQNAPTDPDKFLTLNASNVVTYRTGAEVLSDIGGQGSITLTTTGTSGAATLVGNTLNIPQYSPDLSGYVPNTRTLTINGTSYDLSANRTWSVGTVTSVGLSTGTTGTDVNVSGSPVTSSGTITLNIPTASATSRGVLLSSDWTTFNNKQNAITLTTSGSSGAATLVGSTLNIPQYQAVLSNPVTGTGTTNYVTKWTSSSAVGNSQIFDNGTNVGIGTNTPTRTLDVNGIITTNNNLELTSANPTILWTTSNLRFYNNTNGVVATISSAGQLSLSSIPNATTDTDKFLVSDGGVVKYRTGSEVLSDIGAASSSSISGTTNYIPKFTSSSAIGNSQIFDNGTNVGLGTASPSGSYRLTILGSTYQVGTDSKLYIDNGGVGGASAILGVVGTSYGYLNTDGNFPFVFQTNNTERLRITSSGSVGIGTSTPDGIIDVTSTVAGTAYSYFQNESTTGVTSVGLAFAQSGTIKSSIQSAVYGNDYMTFNVGSNTERMRLDASGNLGLGTSNPLTRLHIQGNNTTGKGQFVISSASAGQEARMTFVDGSDDIAEISTDGNDLYFYNEQATGKFLWYTAGSLRATLDASGNLGLGVSPSAWGTNFKVFDINTLGAIWSGSGVDFASTGNAYYTATGARYKTTAAATDYWQIGGEHRWYTAPSGTAGNAISFTQAMTLDASGNLGVGVTNPAQKLHIAGTSTSAMIVGNADGSSKYYQLSYNNGQANSRSWRLGNDVISYGDFAIQQSTTQTGSTFSSLLYVGSGGNVGIGTTSPAVKLHVIGTSSNNALRLDSDASGTYTILDFANAGNVKSQIFNDLSGGDLWMRTIVSSNLIFGTNSLERMRITSGGNVLVNTTSVGSLGNGIALRGDNNGVGGYGYIQVGGTGTESRAMYIYNSNGLIGSIGTNGTGLVFASGSGDAERMRITSGGNVGIGTTSPTQKLTIGATNGYPIIDFYNSGTGFGDIGYNAGTTSFNLSSYSTTPLAFYTNGSERMRITSGGLVGIGTANPSEKFTVVTSTNYAATFNTSSIENTTTRINIGSLTTGGGGTGGSVAIGSAHYHAASAQSQMLFYTHDGTSLAERMRITSGGEVLVNTTSDAGDYKLQVNGSAWIGTSSSASLILQRGANTNGATLDFNTSTTNKWFMGLRGLSDENFYIYNQTAGANNLILDASTGAATFSSSIKTAAPSGGTPKPWKLGEAGVTLGGSNTSGVRVEIDGTVYYLVTGYLP